MLFKDFLRYVSLWEGTAVGIAFVGGTAQRLSAVVTHDVTRALPLDDMTQFGVFYFYHFYPLEICLPVEIRHSESIFTNSKKLSCSSPNPLTKAVTIEMLLD